MKPESAAFVRKADIMLDRATRMLAGELYEDAARSAYLACFHVAQALIFEHTERVHKSHNGVQSEFNRLIRGDARVDDTLRKFLSRGYEFKSVADYGTGPESLSGVIWLFDKAFVSSSGLMPSAGTPTQSG